MPLFYLAPEPTEKGRGTQHCMLYFPCLFCLFRGARGEILAYHIIIMYSETFSSLVNSYITTTTTTTATL